MELGQEGKQSWEASEAATAEACCALGRKAEVVVPREDLL